MHFYKIIIIKILDKNEKRKTRIKKEIVVKMENEYHKIS